MNSEHLTERASVTGQTANGAASVVAGDSLLDAVLSATQRPHRHADNRLDLFLREKSLPKALAAWFGPDLPADHGALARRLNRDIASLDALLTEQVNAVL